MSQIIDRRLNGKNKSAVNRQRFIRRFKAQIKKAVADAVSERSIKEINSGEQINIPAGDISEPVFHHGAGGEREAVHPGNAEYVTGDKIKRPPDASGGRSRATNTGEGLDDFIFNLSREEFLEFFFEDLALPDLVKKQLATNVEFKSVRAGYSRDGVPTNINVVRSLKGALARRTALRAPYNARLRTAEESLALLPALDGETEDEDLAARRTELEEEITHLRQRIGAVPFIDTFDLRYNNRIRQPKPTSRAVMFCLMDVSGSMDEERKDIAKRFFILLYLFLTRNYERTDVVFIRHHTTAKEVDEDEFFHSRETGGTVVSSALQLMHEIICARYPTADWNIYAAQASDGDNWNDDSPLCRDLLTTKIMPLLQYFAYVEITPEEHQSLWREYQGVKSLHRNFAMQRIDDLGDIYPVFRSLFKKKAS